MTLLISLLAGLATGAGAMALFEWRWGRATWRRDMQADLNSLTAAGQPPSTSGRVWQYLAPQEIRRLKRFWLQWVCTVAGAVLVGDLFTGSWLWATLLGLIALVAYRPVAIRQAGVRRRQLLGDQFKEALSSISTSIRAGSSLVTAFERAVPDLERLLRGQPETPIIEEMSSIHKELRMGSSLEEALLRFRNRVNLEDVTDFVNATLLCRVRGGNLTEVIAVTAQIISDRVAVRHQVRVLTAGKRMEFWLLTLAPPAMLGFMLLTSPDYLTPMLESLLGQALMVLALLLLVGAFLIGRRIVDLEV